MKYFPIHNHYTKSLHIDLNTQQTPEISLLENLVHFDQFIGILGEEIYLQVIYDNDTGTRLGR